ncbi:B12-binding domain-containing radical SAM protein [Nanoarchaeota archaeon]
MNEILLVQARGGNDLSQYSSLVLEQIKRILPDDSRLKKHFETKKAVHIPGLAMPIIHTAIKQYCRDNVNISFVDQRIEHLNYDIEADLVFISANTTTATHVYHMASKFRENGAKVVLGGPHVSACPVEALKYADAVVKGEAELILEKILEDFQNGHLKGIYRANKLINMNSDYLTPDISIFNEKYYLGDSIEVSRGCPKKCLYCYGPVIHGNKYRTRPVMSIINQIKESESDYIFFPSDNLVGDPEHANKLLSELKKLDKRWIGSASADLAKDRKLTELVIKSGCKLLIVGFESISEIILDKMGKPHNKGVEYGKFVKHLQNNGVIVAACFILDYDPKESLNSIRDQLKYLEDNEFLLPMFANLTPYPGTPIFNQMKSKGILIPDLGWEHYDARSGKPVFYRPNHTPEYLDALEKAVTQDTGLQYFIKQIQNRPDLIEKFAN